MQECFVIDMQHCEYYYLIMNILHEWVRCTAVCITCMPVLLLPFLKMFTTRQVSTVVGGRQMQQFQVSSPSCTLQSGLVVTVLGLVT